MWGGCGSSGMRSGQEAGVAAGWGTGLGGLQGDHRRLWTPTGPNCICTMSISESESVSVSVSESVSLFLSVIPTLPLARTGLRRRRSVPSPRACPRSTRPAPAIGPWGGQHHRATRTICMAQAQPRTAGGVMVMHGSGTATHYRRGYGYAWLRHSHALQPPADEELKCSPDQELKCSPSVVAC